MPPSIPQGFTLLHQFTRRQESRGNGHCPKRKQAPPGAGRLAEPSGEGTSEDELGSQLDDTTRGGNRELSERHISYTAVRVAPAAGRRAGQGHVVVGMVPGIEALEPQLESLAFCEVEVLEETKV